MRRKLWSELTPSEKALVIIRYILTICIIFLAILIATNFSLFSKMFGNLGTDCTVNKFLKTFWLFILRALGLSS